MKQEVVGQIRVALASLKAEVERLEKLLEADSKKAGKRTKLKLIVEVTDGVPHVYRETLEHFAQVQGSREAQSTRLTASKLDHQCDLRAHGDDFHMIFDLASWPEED